ncbi:putative phospholipid hydroperoxide glutathione peroxidase 6, mitochondrial [Folsomia candida]|uniref:Putative phospholipid hydroperoxide glutathione peroxidase 6, mitochondrial n=1 Tax=Folsomia candida TaxID=158441 RepID=A0A226EGV5_FOLCA|nr:putative phospholipid hydroperoxide glutathione peroxidase 6, mitochondrial [Folsomia candida]
MHPLITTTVLLLLTPPSLTLQSLYSFTLPDITGKEIDFSTFKGKTILVVNVASQCGQTDAHYKSLKRLHDILSFSPSTPDGGSSFEILAFPSNDFGDQEPWEEKEIEEFVRGHFKAEFLLFPKTIVKGEEIHPFWKWIAGWFP